jgi:hypothetical protein
MVRFGAIGCDWVLLAARSSRFKVQSSRFKVQGSRASAELEGAKIAGSGRPSAYEKNGSHRWTQMGTDFSETWKTRKFFYLVIFTDIHRYWQVQTGESGRFGEGRIGRRAATKRNSTQSRQDPKAQRVGT